MRRLVLPLIWLASAAAAQAQQQPAVSLSASLTGVWLVRGEVCCQSSPSLPTTGIGGSAVGGALGIDITASRRVGIDAELSLSGHLDDYQEAIKYHNKVRHRDTILSGLVRVRLMPGALVRVEPVAGMGVAFADTLLSTSRQVFVPLEHYDEFSEYMPWGSGGTRPALSFGVDVPIGRGHFAVVPTLRVHYIFRDDVNEQIGVGSWSIRPGIGVSISF